MSKSVFLSSVAVIGLMQANFVHASTITSTANQEDDGGTVVSSDRSRSLVGEYKGTLTNVVVSFQLPVLANGQSLSAVSLSVPVDTYFYNTENGADTVAKVDLYGLTPGTSATQTSASAGYYVGTSDSNATLIQASFLTNTMGIPSASTGNATTVGTSSSGNAALLSYLNAAYSTVGAGNYVYLRFSPEAGPNGTTATGGYDVYENNATAPTTGAPTITYSTVPEPASLALLGLGGAGLLKRRRRAN